MKAAIRQRAAELGFDDCRITTAAPPASADKFRDWLTEKQHGEMAWLERNADKRVDPQKILPGAKSVICLAVSYAAENPNSDSSLSLTPTLSRWERENRSPRSDESTTAYNSNNKKFPRRNQNLFPLPAGEGQGENSPNPSSHFEPLNRADSIAGSGTGVPPVSSGSHGRDARATTEVHGEGERSNNSSGLIARYARFTDYHDVLAEKLKNLSEFIKSMADCKVLWYVDTGPILERDFAQRAGLGFVGKHTNLISRRLGNWIFLAEILTTLELEPDAPEKNHCGSCTRCLTACPTNAITAPFQLDARRCISYLTIELKGSIPVGFRRAIGNRIYGCDDCLAVCPWNKFARAGNLMQPHARAYLAQPDLLELLALDEAGFKTRFAGTPMLRTKRRGILRNVCVALGNVGDETALSALARAATDKEPLIAEHARWALAEIEARKKC